MHSISGPAGRTCALCKAAAPCPKVKALGTGQLAHIEQISRRAMWLSCILHHTNMTHSRLDQVQDDYDKQAMHGCAPEWRRTVSRSAPDCERQLRMQPRQKQWSHPISPNFLCSGDLLMITWAQHLLFTCGLHSQHQQQRRLSVRCCTAHSLADSTTYHSSVRGHKPSMTCVDKA